MVGTKQKGLFRIHNARFYNLTPRAINYLAYNKNCCKLAISRNDASIEIWDMRHAPYMEKTILGSPEASIEAIGWANDRLFSTGHTGELIEWDLKTLTVKQSVLLTGNVAWCLDVNRTNDLIAIGTEEGYINLYSVEDEELNYVKIFDKQEGRVLCCKFDHSGDIVVTGSLDTVRIWNVKTGQAIVKMSTGRSETKKPTIVWSVAVLKDLTIISGDSRGRITIWDGKIGSQVDSFTALKADVLAVAVNEEETTLYCSGVDPIIKMFVQTPIKRENQVTNKWIKFIQRSVHDHDVRALECTGTKVFSGGIDGYLGVSYSTKSKQELTKYGPFLQQPCAVLATEARLILFKYFNYLELWELGNPTDTIQLNDDDKEKGKFLVLEKGLNKLIQLRSKDDEPIVCCSVSSDGTWLAYSTNSFIRLFRIDTKSTKTCQVTRIENLPNEFSPSTKIVFLSNSKVFLAKKSNSIDMFSLLDDGTVKYKESIDTSKVIKDTLSILLLSDCGKYLVCAGTCCTVAIWKSNKKKSNGWQHLLNLPKYYMPPTAIAIHQNSPRLVAVFADSKIFEYDLEEMRFTCSTNEFRNVDITTHAICNIVLDPENEDIVMMHNDTTLYVIRKTQSSKFGPKARRMDDDDDNNVDDYKLKFSKNYKHFVHLARLSPKELVAVGVNPVTLIEQLPPSLRLKKFGAA